MGMQGAVKKMKRLGKPLEKQMHLLCKYIHDMHIFKFDHNYAIW